jgi:hypothetical protein
MHEAVRGIAVQAAQDAAEVPLFRRKASRSTLYTLLDARIEHGVEIESAGDEDPEQEQSQCPEVA